MIYDSKCRVGTNETALTRTGMQSSSLTFGPLVPCYLTAEGASRNLNGQEAVRMTHLLYVPYGEYSPSQVVAQGAALYDIAGVFHAPGRHHTELTLTIREV